MNKAERESMSYWNDGLYTENDELYHFGIKGMKWGVRRYQNEDGSLTPAGKTRYAEEYKRESVKAMNDLQKQYTRMYVDSYNKAADIMNNGGIDKFNKKQAKKYGKNYANREGYDEDMMKEANKHLTKIMNQSIDDFYSSNKHMKKAQALVDKYGMTEWDDLAKSNSKAIAEVRKAAGR